MLFPRMHRTHNTCVQFTAHWPVQDVLDEEAAENTGAVSEEPAASAGIGSLGLSMEAPTFGAQDSAYGHTEARLEDAAGVAVSEGALPSSAGLQTGDPGASKSESQVLLLPMTSSSDDLRHVMHQ